MRNSKLGVKCSLQIEGSVFMGWRFLCCDFNTIRLKPFGRELKSVCDWGRINILICGPRDLLSAASDSHPIPWPGESRRHQSPAATSDCWRVIQMGAAAKCSVPFQQRFRTGTRPDWTFHSWQWRPDRGNNATLQGLELLLPRWKQNRKRCHSALMCTLAWNS